jgi:hypothetical protein
MRRGTRNHVQHAGVVMNSFGDRAPSDLVDQVAPAEFQAFFRRAKDDERRPRFAHSRLSLLRKAVRQMHLPRRKTTINIRPS